MCDLHDAVIEGAVGRVRSEEHHRLCDFIRTAANHVVASDANGRRCHEAHCHINDRRRYHISNSRTADLSRHLRALAKAQACPQRRDRNGGMTCQSCARNVGSRAAVCEFELASSISLRIASRAVCVATTALLHVLSRSLADCPALLAFLVFPPLRRLRRRNISPSCSSTNADRNASGEISLRCLSLERYSC